MCATCGCGDDATTITVPGHDHIHDHPHPHDHDHPHDHAHPPTETITLEQKVLAKNDLLAEQNRAWLAERNIAAFNLTSSPGAGKTTLLERTIRELVPHRPVSVIEGDQETLLDAERIHAAGARAVQVNTGAGCHLDAAMVRRALDTLDPEPDSILFIENVGNLVCPASFDLGAHRNVTLLSVTEGDDKPAKYPVMFRAGDLTLITKVDLLPHLEDFSVDRARDSLRQVGFVGAVLEVSKRGAGLTAWLDWLRAEVASRQAAAA